MEARRFVQGKFLRWGVSTGSCAAAAVKAAASLLFLDRSCAEVAFKTPQGKALQLPIAKLARTAEGATATVVKDAGDDPDITNACQIVVQIKPCAAGIFFLAGEGVGHVTKPGLDQPPGAPAINRGPQQMMREALEDVFDEAGFRSGCEITVSIPGGAALAAKTFNPRLGIKGGLSILGSTGLVKPMSHQALADTVRAEIQIKQAEGHQRILLCPGQFGKRYALEQLGLDEKYLVLCSNGIADAAEACAEAGIRELLLVGHLGKLMKLALGVRNTHSRYGDGRVEAMIAAALRAGADLACLRALAEAVSSEAMLEVLKAHKRLESTLSVLQERMVDTWRRHNPSESQVGLVCFHLLQGRGRGLCMDAHAQAMMEAYRE